MALVLHPELGAHARLHARLSRIPGKTARSACRFVWFAAQLVRAARELREAEDRVDLRPYCDSSKVALTKAQDEVDDLLERLNRPSSDPPPAASPTARRGA